LEFDIKVKEINIDEEDDLCEQYEIRSIPTLIFFKNNIQVLKTTGSKSKEQLKVIINKIRNNVI
jgi:thioredoxin 1